MAASLHAYTFILELAKAASTGWLPFFAKHATAANWPLPILLGIASRESNMRHIIGDRGNGYGLMQIDIRTDPDVPNYWMDLDQYFTKATAILSAKRLWLQAEAGKQKTVQDSRTKKEYPYTVPFIPNEPMLNRIALAMYNSGAWAAYHYSLGRDPDRGTTPGPYSPDGKGDYSADVIIRAAIFDTWIDNARRITDGLTPDSAASSAPSGV